MDMSAVTKLLSIFSRNSTTSRTKSVFEQERHLRAEMAFQDIYLILVSTTEAKTASTKYLQQQQEWIVNEFRKSPETNLKSHCLDYIESNLKQPIDSETVDLIKQRLNIAGFSADQCEKVIAEFQSLTTED